MERSSQRQRIMGIINKKRDSSPFSMTKENNISIQSALDNTQDTNGTAMELSDCLIAMNQLETEYLSAKIKINTMDFDTQESLSLADTMLTCNAIMGSQLASNDESTIELQRVARKAIENSSSTQDVIQTLSKVKAQFIMIHDLFVNKNMLVFKLSQLEGFRDKQKDICEAIPLCQSEVQIQTDKNTALKTKFMDELVASCNKKFNEITSVKHQAKKGISLIQEQFENIKQTITDAKQHLQKFKPMSKKDKLSIESMKNDLSKMKGYIESVTETIEEELNQFQELEKRLNKIQEENKLLGKGTTRIFTNNQLIEQTRHLERLCKNLAEWKKFLEGLQKLDEQKLGAYNQQAELLGADIKNLENQADETTRIEADDMLRQIKKIADRLDDEVSKEQLRLSDIQTNVVKSDEMSIKDMTYIQQEISKNRSALLTTQEQAKDALKASVFIIDDDFIPLDSIEQLKEHLNSLEKQESLDLPRIVQNIDEIYNFAQKLGKNKLFDENKKNQNKISHLKGNLGEFQKKINDLNDKIEKVGDEVLQVRSKLKEKDQEYEQRLAKDIIDQLKDIEQLVNKLPSGNRSNRRGSLGDVSLVEMKRMIIADLNSLVLEFNNNNQKMKDQDRAIRDSNSGKIKDFMTKNQELNEMAAHVDETLHKGINKANTLEKRLDQFMIEKVLPFKEEFEDKHEKVEVCNQMFEELFGKIYDKESEIDDKLRQVNALIDQLKRNGTPEQVTRAKKMKEDLLKQKANLNYQKDLLKNRIDRLDSLDTSIIGKDEVETILKELREVQKDLDAETDISDIQDEINDLKNQASTTNQEDLDKMFDEIDKAGRKLDVDFNKQDEIFNNLIDRIEQVNQAILDSQRNTDTRDRDFRNQLDRMKTEGRELEKKIRDIFLKRDRLKKQKDKNMQVLERMKDPNNTVMEDEVKDLQQSFEDLAKNLKDNQKKNKVAESDLEVLEKKVLEFIGQKGNKKKLEETMQSLAENLGEDMQTFEESIDEYLNKCKMILLSCQEMKKDSEPDYTADYWEERNQIERAMKSLNKEKESLLKFRAIFEEKDDYIKGQMEKIRRSNFKVMQEVVVNLKKTKADVQNILENLYDTQDEINKVKDDLNESDIPSNIGKRTNELAQLEDRLKIIKKEYQDSKQTEEEFSKAAKQDARLRNLFKDIDGEFRSFDREKARLFTYLAEKLEGYLPSDLICDKNHNIIAEVRTLKGEIKEAGLKLDNIGKMLQDLNKNLIAQDIKNGVKVLDNKTNSLYERLKNVQDQIQKIDNTAKEMDGNTSNNEEDDFLDALKDELPQVFKAIDENFKQINEFNTDLKKQSGQASNDSMQNLREGLEQISSSIQNQEQLVNKLENEFVEWNPNKKLKKREKELSRMEEWVSEAMGQLEQENELMDKALSTIVQELEEGGETQQEQKENGNNLKNYIEKINAVNGEFESFYGELDNCMNVFDAMLPAHLRPDYNSRPEGQKPPGSRQSTPPKKGPSGQDLKNSPKRFADVLKKLDQEGINRVYQCLNLNCRFKPQIKDLQARLKELLDRKIDLLKEGAGIKNNLKDFNLLYSPDTNDQADVMLAEALQRRNSTLGSLMRRISIGKYEFGNKHVLSKIVNGKLIIRVGGGYMLIDEFIEQYSKMAHMKLRSSLAGQKLVEESDGAMALRRNSINARRMSIKQQQAIGIGEFKSIMKYSFLQIEKGSPNRKDGSRERTPPKNLMGADGYMLSSLTGGELKQLFEDKIKRASNSPTNDRGQRGAKTSMDQASLEALKKSKLSLHNRSRTRDLGSALGSTGRKTVDVKKKPQNLSVTMFDK